MTETEYLERLAAIDLEDPGIPSHRRFAARDELAKQVASSGSEALKRAAELEVLLSFGHAREMPPAHEDFHEKLRTEAGLDWALAQLSGRRSAIVRAAAGWLLWSSRASRFRRHAPEIAAAHVEAHRVVAVHVMRVESTGAAIEAVHRLSSCIEVVRQTRQGKSLYERILDCGLALAVAASSQKMRRWRLDIGAALARLPAEVLQTRRQELEVVAGLLEQGADGERDRHLVRLGFLRAAIALRSALNMPGSGTHGPASVARIIEEDGLQGPPLRGIPSLRQAIEEYRRLPGHDADVRRVQLLLEERLRMAPSTFKAVPFEFRIPKNVVEQIVAPYRRLSVARGLNRLALDPNLQIDREAMGRSSEEADRQFLHRQLFSSVVFQGDGTTLRPQTEEGQRNMRALADVAQQQQINSVFLHFVLDALKERGMTPDELVHQLMHESLFEPSERPFIECGVRHWASEDYISSLSVLVPRTERMLRRLAASLGVNTTVVRADADERSQLGTVLERLAIAAADEPARNLFFELRVFLDGDGGRAVRHQIAHGLAELSLFTRATTDTLIALLVRLSALQHSERTTEAAPPPEDTSSRLPT